MNKVAAFALRRKNSILSMSEEVFCPPQPLRFWITPACAGKRIWGEEAAGGSWDHPRVCGEKSVPKKHKSISKDHPRVCGEKYTNYSDGSGQQGSPPRMRGKGCLCGFPRNSDRITPAHAGKRQAKRCLLENIRDHPRACGEKVSVELSPSAYEGSPPRMRGKDAQFPVKVAQNGITPAHAGKS